MSTLRKFSPWLLLFGCYAAHAQDAKQIVQQAVNAEMNASRTDHTHWMFRESDRKPKDSVEQWVVGTQKGSVTRVLSRNGEKTSEAQQRKEIDDFVHDPSAQAKQHQSDQRDDKQAEDLLKLLPVAFLWTQTSKSTEATVFHFKPDPNFDPPNREARVFSAMEGDMTVNNDQHRIQSLKGQLIHDVTFGGGLLGRLKQGGSFNVERRQLERGIWQITATHINIQGHALLFKSISEQEDDEKSLFERQPDNITLEQAVTAVMGKK